MQANVFINYRRDETAGITGRLYDRLAKEFGSDTIFMDVDAMKPGLDFVRQLDDQISSCGILLCMMGPQWLTVTDDTGQRRIAKPNDFVRAEIASALKRGIPVVPILLDGATMPHEEDLPDDLKSLARRHAVELRHSRFAADAEVIVSTVRSIMPKARSRTGAYAAVAALLLAGAGGGVYWYSIQNPQLASAVGLIQQPTPKTASAQLATPAATPAAKVEQKAADAAPGVSKEPVKPAEQKPLATWRSFPIQVKLDKTRPNEVIRRPYVGVNMMDLTPIIANVLKLSVTDGVIVNTVTPDAPGAAAGLLPGDVITAINRQSIRTGREFTTTLVDVPFGSTATLVIWRLGTGSDSLIEMLNAAAVRGDPKAMTELGYSYVVGRGVSQDFVTAREWYEKAVDKGDGDAMARLAFLYVNAQGVARDEPKAFALLQKAAATSSPMAMGELAVAYRYARGTPRDFLAARQWYQKAADAGYHSARLALAELNRDGLGAEKDLAKARDLFEAEAKDGDVSAMYSTGNFYLNGVGGPQDHEKARVWLEKAAKLGNTSAMVDLGNSYFNGNGVAKDYAKARDWYEQSGTVSSAALSNLGMLYARGLGVKQDYVKAKDYFEQAAAKDSAYAMSWLGDLYSAGNGVELDHGKARLWYEKAALKGEVSAMTSLGWYYRYGNGIAQDYAKAKEWYMKAADRGSKLAMASLGSMNSAGHGAPPDYLAARQWYEKAGDTQLAVFGLGYIYDVGLGVEKDLTKARQLYFRAAELGSFAGMNNLALMEDRAAGGVYEPKSAAKHVLAAAKGGIDAARKQLATPMTTWSQPARIAIQQELVAARFHSGTATGDFDATWQSAAERYWKTPDPK